MKKIFLFVIFISLYATISLAQRISQEEKQVTDKGALWIKETLPSLLSNCDPISFNKMFSWEEKISAKKASNLCDKIQKRYETCSVAKVKYLYPSAEIKLNKNNKQEQIFTYTYHVDLSCSNKKVLTVVTLKKEPKSFSYMSVLFSTKVTQDTKESAKKWLEKSLPKTSGKSCSSEFIKKHDVQFLSSSDKKDLSQTAQEWCDFRYKILGSCKFRDFQYDRAWYALEKGSLQTNITYIFKAACDNYQMVNYNPKTKRTETLTEVPSHVVIWPSDETFMFKSTNIGQKPFINSYIK